MLLASSLKLIPLLRRVSLFLSCFAVCSSTPRVHAQVNALNATFQQLDKNADGKITRDESPQPDSFDVADADNNESVTLDELRRHIAQSSIADVNGDGCLDFAIPCQRHEANPLDSQQPQLQKRWPVRLPIRAWETKQSGREGHAPQRKTSLAQRWKGGPVREAGFGKQQADERVVTMKHLLISTSREDTQ